MSSEREETYVVLVRPKGIGPSWWPAVKPERVLIVAGEEVGVWLEYDWQTVNSSGGFTNGLDRQSAVSGDAELEERVEAWFDAHEDDPWPWELAQLRLTD